MAFRLFGTLTKWPIFLLLGWWVFAHGGCWLHLEVFHFLEQCFGFRTGRVMDDEVAHSDPVYPFQIKGASPNAPSKRIYLDLSTASGNYAVELSLLGAHRSSE